MSNFAVPYSSSPPSTPDTRRRQQSNPFTGSLNSNPSTTPAGPPGPQFGSFTPAGPPPSTPFGSSQIKGRGDAEGKPKSIFASYGFGVQTPEANLFARPPESSPVLPPFLTRTKNGTPAEAMHVPSGHVSGSSQAESGSDGDDEDDYDDNDDDGDDDDDNNGDDEEEDPVSQSGEGFERGPSRGGSETPDVSSSSESDSDSATCANATQSTRSVQRGTKRSYAGGIIDPLSRSISPVSADQQMQSALPSIARGLAERLGPAALREPDNMILRTEELMERLGHSQTNSLSDEADNPMLSSVTEKVLELWESIAKAQLPESEGYSRRSAGIQRKEISSPLKTAIYLTDILLRIHHPPQLKASNTFPQTRGSRALGFSQSFDSRAAGKPVPIPKVLLDWLQNHHNPFPNALSELRSYRPNPTYSSQFWPLVLTTILRGKLDEVIHMLKQADFRHPQVALDDNLDQSQLPEVRLGSIRVAMNRAIQVLEQCPAVAEGNWDVCDNDWSVFRIKVSQAKRDLGILAGQSEPDEARPTTMPFSAENFGIRSNAPEMPSLAKASQQAQSKVPWPIYQNLKVLYDILGGDATEILAFSQDWIEATLSLTIWCNEEPDANHGARPRSRKTGLSLSQPLSRLGPDRRTMYLQRLRWSFDRATDSTSDGTFRVDTLNMSHVGLASIFEGNIEGVVGLLRGLSLVVTSAVVQIAKGGGWLNTSSDASLMGEFDQTDLMVLSYDQPLLKASKDKIFVEYADALFGRDRLVADKTGRGGKGTAEKEGWELGIQVLGRLDDKDMASQKVSEFLDRLPLNSGRRVDKLMGLCREIGLSEQAIRLAERYADSLAETSYDYGETLIYYAHAHQQRKLKNVLDLLVSFCLVQSMAYPPDSELDDHLRRLIASPKEALGEVARADFEAAELLQFHLSGYASVRKFYDLRDEEVHLKSGQKPKLREQGRKRQALATLLAIITSATDNIHGGLYDETRGSVVSVDGVLVLLGEAMVFVDQPKRILNLPQAFQLLKAIEDLQTVRPRIYSQCEELFQSAISSARAPGAQGQSPRNMLKQSISSMTSSSGFSLIGSSVLGRHTNGTTQGGGIVSSAEVKRGWDWRTGLPGVVSGQDVLQILRLGLAKELARGWLAGEEGFH